MSVKIRQEINILTAILAGASTSTVTSKEIIQLDTTQYVNPTYYFEIIAKNAGAGTGADTITLRRNGTATDDASLNADVGGSTYKRYRSASFTPPVGQTEYVVTAGATGTLFPTVRSAKLVVIDNPTTLTATETQIEIGMTKTGLTSSVSAPKVVPDSTLTKYWLYTAANWDSTETFFAEITYLMASSKSGGTFVLQEDDGAFGTWTDKVTIVSAGVATVATRVRSASFTPTDGRHYKIAYFVASSKSAASIFNAKIIVDQADGVQLKDDTDSNAFPIVGGTAGSAQTNQAQAQSFKIRATSTITGVSLKLFKSGLPTDTINVDIVSALGGSSLANATLSSSTLTTTGAVYALTFGTPVTLTGNTTYYIQVTRSPDTAGGSNFIEWDKLFNDGYSDGSAQSRSNNVWGAVSGDFYFQLAGQAGISLLEPQYLLLNTADSNATGVQTFPTLWDSTEWSGVTNVYKHAIDSDNASNSAKLTDITASADVTSSTVTGANQQISSALTMPTTGHEIDTNILNTTGVVGASRILVAVTITSSVTTTKTQTGISRITATTTKNQLGKGDILKTTTQTQPGKSRIALITPQTVPGKARISGITPQTQLGKANIRNTTLKTQPGLSRIQVSVTKTTTGTASISALVSRLQTGVTRITVTTVKTLLGKGDIAKIAAQTQPGKSRIQITTTQTMPGKSRITAATTQTQPGKARVTAATSKTQTGLARVTAATLKTLTGLARVTASASKTITGLARLTASTSQTMLGKARITAATLKSQLGKASMIAGATQTILGKARVTIITAKAQTGLARLTASTVKTIAGLARLQVSTPKTQTGLSRIQLVTTQTVSGKGDIRKTTSQTVPGKARLQILSLQTILGHARLQQAVSKTMQGISRLQLISPQTIAGKARVTVVTLRTVTGLARLTAQSLRTTTGRARLTAQAVQTILGLARLQLVTPRTIAGQARLTAQASRTVAGRSRLQVTTSQTVVGHARIQTTVTQAIAGHARLQTLADQLITGHSRILTTVNQAITGRARITAQASRIVTGLSRVSQLRQETLQGLASIRLQSTFQQSISGRAHIINTWYQPNRKNFSAPASAEWYNHKQNDWSAPR